MASKSMVAMLMMANLAMFAFVSTNATITDPKKQCPTLGVCLDIADSLLHVQFGENSKSECCGLLKGLVDLDAAVCLCTGLKTGGLGGNILGSALGLAQGLLGGLLNGITGPVLDNEILLLLNACGRRAPSDFKCPA